MNKLIHPRESKSTYLKIFESEFKGQDVVPLPHLVGPSICYVVENGTLLVG